MPVTLGWFDHLLFFVLAVVFPVRAGLFGYRRLMRTPDADLPRVKLSIYRQVILLQWAFAALVAALWLWLRRDWSRIGLAPLATGGLAGVLVGLVLIAVVMLRSGQLIPATDAGLDRIRDRTRHLERMLPRTTRERSWFFGLSITAGVCEETLYRGYVIWYLSAWFSVLLPRQELFLVVPGHVFLAAALASSLVFGLGHAYQGPRGVLSTAVVGAFLAAVYWITRSLFAGMLIHALMDLHAGYVTWLAYRGAPESEETVASCDTRT